MPASAAPSGMGFSARRHRSASAGVNASVAEQRDALAQLRERDSRRRRRLRDQAGRRHPRKRVRLEAVELARGRHAEIDARAAAELERRERRRACCLHASRLLRGQRRREDLLGHPRRVLALVVVDLVLRDDLAHRKRLAAKDADRQLPPGDELLDHRPRHRA